MTKILKNLFLFFSIAAAVTYFTSCEKYTYVIKPPEIDTNLISFSEVIQPIFDAKCISCHGGVISPDLRTANSYNALSTGGYVTQPAEDCKLYDYVVNQSSHASYTNQEEKNKIYSWIAQGAKEYTSDKDEDN